MKNIFRIFFLLVIIIVLEAPNLRAQRKIATPLEPELRPLKKKVGLIAGIGQNYGTGWWSVNCDSCVFKKNPGFGYTFGAFYQQEFTPTLWLGGMLRYDFMGVSSAFNEKEGINFVSGDTINELRPINILNKSDADFSYISFYPYMNLDLWEFMYFKAGPVVSYVLSSHRNHTGEVTDEFVLLSNGDSAKVEQLNEKGEVTDEPWVFEDGKFPLINKLQFSLSGMIGADIIISSYINICPVFEFNYPLTKISEDGEDFRLGRWRFLVELKFDIKPPKKTVK